MISESSSPMGALDRVSVYVSPAVSVPAGMLRSRPCAKVAIQIGRNSISHASNPGCATVTTVTSVTRASNLAWVQ